MRTNVLDTKDKIGEKVELFGWVWSRRDHGKIIFIDLGDKSGQAQVVFTPDNKDLYEIADQVRQDWVLKIVGTISKRPDKMINSDLETGKIEVQPESIEVLAKSETSPFALDTDGKEMGEESRMKYRYLDLRRRRMQDNLILRYRITRFIRDYLDRQGFLELETPILTKATPEGARDYVVPSRVHNGKFYALPQSPQQYKQLLMVAGFEKYFQIARCFRDEDTRGDRQPEFTQLDLEMSFVEREDVLSLTEDLFTEMVEKILPGHHITTKPFPRLTYSEAMEKYGSDKPDLRKDKNNPKELAFAFVIDFPMFEYNEEKKKWDSTHHPFTKPKKEHLKYFETGELEKMFADSYDFVLNGNEIASGSIRINEPELQAKVFETLGLSKDEIDSKFGHIIEAFKYGAPPHGGIAPGLDRFVMIVADEPNIREVIAFPKTGDGRDLMMDGPSELSKEQLDELGIQVKK